MNSATVEMEVQTVFLRYILAPLLVFISAIVMSVWNKKNSLLSNKKLIISILLGGLALALPGFFGFLGFAFMPWGYFMTMIYAFGVGFYGYIC
ncbi:TssN family type VI secretion system protein [Sphingobacterium sp. E70]|nr:TssN family type VI secretion system protein [Sphingobacterium sp. E70]ULT25593.1 TssN family type VI secretion system protein [Sphingobacterium sp. E70]